MSSVPARQGPSDGSVASHSSRGQEEDHFAALEKEREQEEIRQREVLSKEESSAVTWLRNAVLFLIVCTAALVSSGVCLCATRGQQDEFESAFDRDAQKILGNLKDALDKTAGAVGGVANAVTNHAMTVQSLAKEEGFPFLAIPNFEILGSNLRVQTGAMSVGYAPLIQEEQRAGWEDYALKNRGQLDVSFEVDARFRQEEDALCGFREHKEHHHDERTQSLIDHPNVLPDGTNYHPKIWVARHGHNATRIGTGPYLPLWQVSPVNPTKQLWLNFDFGDAPGIGDMFPQVLEDPKVIIGKPNVPGELASQQIKAIVGVGQHRHQEGSEYLDDPNSFLFYPIFDQFNRANQKLSAYLIVQFYWRLFFTRVLSTTARGIIVVIEHTYNQSLFYRVDGEEATFLGEGVVGHDPWPLYDENYDYMVVSENLTEEFNRQAGPETRAFTTVQLDGKFGLFKVHVYPSKETEEEHKSNKPVVYTSLVVSTFALTAASFLLFNYIVERRQENVMARAVEARTVVASMFPEKVQERLCDNQGTDQTAPLEMSNGNLDDSDIEAVAHGETVKKDRPIADFYPETTILFADLVGFTRWSSSRSPSDVFELLETLYSAFDGAAIKREVFKVETIGDCYLAVCGLPTPNVDHAVAMAKFASDCPRKMDNIVRGMRDHLGSDTTELKLRVGLHSGATVAGVLRGQRSRFQLFGDTVNTAARMESTGAPGKIQASQDTADQLAMKGKEDWLVPREGVVIAKGKGEMNTFWVDIPKLKRANSSFSISDGATAKGNDAGSNTVGSNGIWEVFQKAPPPK